ncbi:MAG TPA: DUF3891 family protein [Halomicronema sp.]
MIVNLIETGWEIIYHRAHALLAAQLAGQWKKEESPLRLYETVAAISHHDDLEKEWEGNHLTSAGAPLDFTLEKDFQLPKMRDFTQNARYRGRWVALLISMHMSFLNEVRRGELAEFDSFLDEQLVNQKKWRKELGISKEEADKAYAFFRWCDRLSLILCQHKLPDRERCLEITTWPDGTRYEVMQREDKTVTVTPWPFEKKQFTVNVEASNLNQIKFDSSKELTEALLVAPIQVLEWTFIK